MLDVKNVFIFRRLLTRRDTSYIAADDFSVGGIDLYVNTR
jgi:hypothetical protein